MVRIRRFGVIRTANVAALIYLFITLIFVVPFALILAAGGGAPTVPGQPDFRGVGIVFLILIPLLYAGLGWVFTAVGCLLYNLAARFVGGIEVQVERDQPLLPPGWQPAPAWQQAPPVAPPGGQPPTGGAPAG
ncbi:MAG: hypothetical protein ACRDGJ_09460 [Candidatus Limnocylindria bacterium]